MLVVDMSCDAIDELAIHYMLALDAAEAARRQLYQAVTQTQMECASTQFYRIEAHRLSVMRDLALHCELHGCTTSEIEELLARGRSPQFEASAA